MIAASRLSEIGNDLRFAIERNQLRAVYQTKVELKGRRIVGFEALMRWQHPELGLVSLEKNLTFYSWHGRHHVAHVTSLRERNGW